MLLGNAAMFAVPYHTLFHPTSAVLFGTGYGLAYPVIQEQAVNHSSAIHRHAALTWFIVACSLGAFGFPAVGGLGARAGWEERVDRTDRDMRHVGTRAIRTPRPAKSYCAIPFVSATRGLRPAP
ncbi:hypothetical protein [Paraburkholderia youngii]|uniref:hypothetical protein n=1 Tax=Paraburkholderia youngii TaxID=2782701 RepID=UPI0020CD8F8C|nr:hypothetical protein [Paraburkholderia youngii]